LRSTRKTVEVGPRGWRRKWRRVPARQRATAAETLGDLFDRRRIRGSLWIVLAVSLIGHGVLVPLLALGRTLSPSELAAREDSYLRKVLQKERARKVSRDVQDRMTMSLPARSPPRRSSNSTRSSSPRSTT